MGADAGLAGHLIVDPDAQIVTLSTFCCRFAGRRLVNNSLRGCAAAKGGIYEKYEGSRVDAGHSAYRCPCHMHGHAHPMLLGQVSDLFRLKDATTGGEVGMNHIYSACLKKGPMWPGSA